jgi:riboflavin synthase
MFTGIITDIGRIEAAEQRGDLRLRIACGYDMAGVDLGASIACSGTCLTVVDKGENWFAVDLSAETIARTAPGLWAEGGRLNLERALRLGDELGGHIVTGHVDGVATIVAREAITAGDDPWGPTARFVIKAPQAIAPFIAEKGSVCLDGTSLTVNSVSDDIFSVLIIPHTLAVTTWGERQAGDCLNIEVDLMARYAARLADARRAG